MFKWSLKILTFFSNNLSLSNRPGQQPQLVQTIQQNPQIVQIQSQQNQQNQPVQMQQVTVQQSQAQPQQRKGLTLSVNSFVLQFASNGN